MSDPADVIRAGFDFGDHPAFDRHRAALAALADLIAERDEWENAALDATDERDNWKRRVEAAEARERTLKEAAQAVYDEWEFPVEGGSETELDDRMVRLRRALSASEREETHVSDLRRAYRVVDDFEQELCAYTGAPHCVAVDSCTNGLYLSLMLERSRLATRGLTLPRRTYVGVLQAALNAGFLVRWTDDQWTTDYRIEPTRVVDSARRIAKGMYRPGTLTCLSFHAAKQLPLGRGGAVLTDDPQADAWLRRARADGRAPGDGGVYATFPGWHHYMPPPTAALGLWILSRWTTDPESLPADNYPDLSALT